MPISLVSTSDSSSPRPNGLTSFLSSEHVARRQRILQIIANTFVSNEGQGVGYVSLKALLFTLAETGVATKSELADALAWSVTNGVLRETRSARGEFVLKMESGNTKAVVSDSPQGSDSELLDQKSDPPFEPSDQAEVLQNGQYDKSATPPFGGCALRA